MMNMDRINQAMADMVATYNDGLNSGHEYGQEQREYHGTDDIGLLSCIENIKAYRRSLLRDIKRVRENTDTHLYLTGLRKGLAHELEYCEFRRKLNATLADDAGEVIGEY